MLDREPRTPAGCRRPSGWLTEAPAETSGCSSRRPWTGRSTCWSSGSSATLVTHRGRLPQSPVATMDHHAAWAASTACRCSSTSPARPVARSSSPDQASARGADPPAQQPRRPDGRSSRQPQPGRAHPQHGGLPQRPGDHACRHRHRRPRHPRRRRSAPVVHAITRRSSTRPTCCCSAVRRAGAEAPWSPDDRRPGARRPPADLGCRDQADHDPRARCGPPGPRHARPGRASCRRRPGAGDPGPAGPAQAAARWASPAAGGRSGGGSRAVAPVTLARPPVGQCSTWENPAKGA